MMNLRYISEYRTLNNEKIEVKIFQDSTTAFAVTEVELSDLEIEWPEVDKIAPIFSSRATLTLCSDSDRQFVDLYTIVSGSIRMDVYKDSVLYWSGSLDPELYEEPYSYKDGYEVRLTFADFSILDRKKYNLSGFVTFAQLIDTCLRESGVQYTSIKKYISTKLDAALSTTVYGDTSYISDNFYDEEGEAMTLREVLEALLQPFALQLRQKNGHIYIYDLNALSTAFKQTAIVWDAEDATLGVDKVYNNVKVSFSPYENDELLSANVDEDSLSDLHMMSSINVPDEKETIPGFNLSLYRSGSGLDDGPGTEYFQMKAVYSGSDCAGVAYTFHSYFNGSYTQQISQPTETIGRTCFTVPKKTFIGTPSNNYRASYRIRISLDLLFDCRKNPFESASRANDEGAYGRMNDYVKIMYVPIKLTLRDAAGVAICHYDNSAMKSAGGYEQTDARCKWVNGEAAWGNAFLCYYGSDTSKETGVGGWATNKPLIGYYYGTLPKTIEKLGTGEYIKLPEKSGWLELEVGSGTPYYSFMEPVLPHQNIMNEIVWVMYKNVDVKLMDNYGKSVSFEDVETNAWLNKNAKEELSIETTIGTCKETSAIAKGQVYRTYDKAVVGEFVRGAYRNKLEKLLCGTIYSNYASRNIALSGTCEIIHDFGTYTEVNEPGNYIMLSEKQNLHACTSEIKMVTFNPDNYEAIDYK